MQNANAAGTLYLIPTPLGDAPPAEVLPEQTRRIASDLRHFIVERAKSARAFLKRLGTTHPLQTLHLSELNEHTPAQALDGLLAPLRAGHDVGLLSEAGCPAIADPGANLVRRAHESGIRVRPLVGPSSILLSLMACGFTAQRFAFHGYLPVPAQDRARALHELERRAEREDAAQAFIETPYRSPALFAAILTVCRADTWLGLACDLGRPSEWALSRRIADWKLRPPVLERAPCVFLLWRPPPR